MNGLTAGGGVHPRTTWKTGGGPPGCERATNAWRKSGRVFLATAGIVAICGLGLVGAAALEPAGGLGTRVFLAAGGFLLVLSLVPFVLGWRRRERVAFLAGLRNRWVQLARAGDPDDRIEALARAYAGLVGGNLRTRAGAGR